MQTTALMQAATALALVAATPAADAQTRDLGNGFRDHGVATPTSAHRGTVATVDGNGRPVVLSWLMDHRGGYCLLMLDMTTGAARQFATPWRNDSPYTAILSSRNRYYTHCGEWFVEFDPAKPGFTFSQTTTPRMAMSMTEDDSGVIWSATYPQSGVAAYDPKTGTLRDYGHVYKQDWNQYPRSIATDDAGWVYLGIGNTLAQIVMLDPGNGKATTVIPEPERGHGRAIVQRQRNGKVYGWYEDRWWELYRGQAIVIDKPDTRAPKAYITGSQGLFHRRAPTGDEIATFDLENRKLSVTTAAGEAREFAFDYDSEGAHIMGIAAASNGTACGGTAFPMRFFSYDPGKDAWTRHPAYGQWNTLAATDSLFFVGAYAHGSLLEWDPGAAWVDTLKGNPESNPRFLHEAHPTIGRPHGLLAHPDGRHVILAGTPGYGFTGGGLMLWDRQAQTATILEHTALIEWHSTMALVPLPDGRLLGGTTISPGTGGAVKAALAELYILDLGTRKITWHAPLIEGAHAYVDMIMGPAGLVFGCANRTIFFVFDPARRTIVHREAIPEALGPTTSGQGPRIFVPSPDGRFFVLLTKGIAQLDPETYAFTLLAESPVSIAPGGAWLDGRIYFGHGSHLYSWEVPPPNAAE